MTTENGQSSLMERECAAAEAFLNTLRDELRLIAPGVEQAHIQHQEYYGEQRWGAHASMADDAHDDYRDRSVFSFGATLQEAIEQLRVDLTQWQAKMDARTQCCVDGCCAEPVVTTGDGPMCSHHGMQWLASEKTAAAEQSA